MNIQLTQKENHRSKSIYGLGLKFLCKTEMNVQLTQKENRRSNSKYGLGLKFLCNYAREKLFTSVWLLYMSLLL